jgi:cell division protein FtsB
MNDISELERENFMLRARTERLEEELRNTNELLTKLNFELINERNRNASEKP